jgi:hypothetical protein
VLSALLFSENLFEEIKERKERSVEYIQYIGTTCFCEL